MNEERKITVTEDDRIQYHRLDQFLVNKMKDLSRSFIKNLFEKNLITTNSIQKLELKKMPPLGTQILIQVPSPIGPNLIAENIPLDTVFEDEHILIINKKAGMVIHPAAGNPKGTLANALLYHYPKLQKIDESQRPGIVHRLDKGTSGLMVVAKNRKAYEKLILLFSAHDLERKYLALSLGNQLIEKGSLTSLMGRHPRHRLKMSAQVSQGKKAITHYQVLEQFDSCSLLELTLETGRTHQIRVHLSQLLNAPILMDPLYGRPRIHLKRLNALACKHLESYPYPLLHAQELNFKHPITHENLSFKKSPPAIFQKVLEALRVSNNT